MPLQVTGAVASSRLVLQVTFNTNPTASTVNTPAAWTVEPVDPESATVVVVDVSGGANVWDLTVYPAMTPGDDYEVTAITAADGGGAASPDNATATVSASESPADTSEWPLMYLEALTEAVGAEMATVYGRPMTRTVRALNPGDTSVDVESTLAFTGSAVWIAGRRFTFTSKTDGTLLGLVPDDILLTVIREGSEVTLDIATVEPGWQE